LLIVVIICPLQKPSKEAVLRQLLCGKSKNIRLHTL